ncbi:cysteine hydrolase family protein [Rhizorhabdus histidinilytica]
MPESSRTRRSSATSSPRARWRRKLGRGLPRGLGPLPGEAVVTHGRVNAFYASDLEQVLAGIGAERLILAGVATNSVVEHSARHAADMGYAVALAADACSAGQPHLHQAALDNIALLGEVSTVAALLEQDA